MHHYMPAEPVDVNVRCRAAPEINPDAVVEWQWVTNPISTWHQVVHSMVGNITDDNGDGLINRLDIQILFLPAHQRRGGRSGKIVAISGDGSGTHWALMIHQANAQMSASAMVALGDFEEILGSVIPAWM